MRSKRRLTLYLISLSILLSSFLNMDVDYVPNEQTAVQIAEAVWLPIYGKGIYDYKPFKAVLIGDTTWHVFGTIAKSYIKINENGDTTFTITVGGVPHIFLNKSNGKIIDVYHTK